jgi:hypothetical protein
MNPNRDYIVRGVGEGTKLPSIWSKLTFGRGMECFIL